MKTIQPRKQRKERYTAELHKQQKFMHVHLSKDLREKYGTRNVQLKKGDTINVVRGQFKRKQGVVEKIDLKRGLIFVTGIDTIKIDGTKSLYPLKPSKLIIISLDIKDKKRKASIERKSTKSEKVSVKKPEVKEKTENQEKK
jgi:large subunit ribosomal protein L24